MQQERNMKTAMMCMKEEEEEEEEVNKDGGWKEIRRQT